MDHPALYLDCRREFLVACESVKPQWTRAIQHPLRGPTGERLYIDLAWFGSRDAANVLVIGSGTHGAEGPAGSTIQSAALRTGLCRALPPDLAVLFVHAHNPWGFAWLRRCTEDGVDLNRNFVDFTRPLPENPGFDQRFAELLVPEHRIDGPEATATDRELLASIAERGVGHLASGQYRFEFAPFYGGDGPTWSNRRLHRIWRELLAARRRVIYVDLHTGLGERGRGLLMSTVDPGAHERARAIWGDAVHASEVGHDTHYRAHGDLLTGVARALPGVEVVGVVHEFGTQAPIVVLSALRFDHWVWRYGDPTRANVDREKAIKRMRDAFSPGDPNWRASVVGEALGVLRTGVSALGR